ncbi:E3 ubiquitin-protein ligase rnf152-like [Cololabis saira]|uniref:E3 ubiquitin-protein ligase rnf152-like n=1 Tax=Cololabis saira TaxID=129043 RepID=UPI002AD368A0|nr:E3 ubiquitin-protein ligase rnf152-like [Cololabis saira]XP_061584615.1 E3 ubiquitin-protein ligase rnf152-like [Cololabis saira]
MCPEDSLECIVCCHEFSRCDRVPRILHCDHTFCAVCIQKMCNLEGIVNTVSCPLCRWITCIRSTGTVAGVLPVNTEIWDQIPAKSNERKEDSGEAWTDAKPALVQSTLSPWKKSGFVSTLQKLSCVAVRE